MGAQPGSVLFACSENAIRSPLAEALLKAVHGRRIFVDSVGVRAGPADPFVAAVLDEVGIDLTRHRPKTFDDLDDDFFDLIVSLSPEAHHRAIELTRTWPCEVEFWNMPDPSLTEGSREVVLDAYRQLRDLLAERIRTRFPPETTPSG
jgi:protein-tyrosine-phosphatase